MKLEITREIIHLIFSRLGLFANNLTTFNYNTGLIKDDFYIKSLIMQEDEEYKCDVWGSCIMINDFKLEFLITDLSHNNNEYIVLIKHQDDIYLLHLLSSEDEIKSDILYFKESFTKTTYKTQAQLLLAMEKVSEIPVLALKLEDEQMINLLTDYLEVQ
jgi:hypothetical protein